MHICFLILHPFEVFPQVSLSLHRLLERIICLTGLYFLIFQSFLTHFCVYHITEISQATQCLTQFPWTAFLSWFHGIPLSWRFYSLVKSSVSSSYSSSSVLSLNVVVPFHSRLFSLSTFSLGNVIILFTTRVSAISNSLAQIYLPRSRLVSPATSWISPFEYPHT